MKITLFGSKDFDSLEYHLNDSISYLGYSVVHIDINDIISLPYRYNYYATKFIKKYDEFIFKLQSIDFKEVRIAFVFYWVFFAQTILLISSV